MSDAKPSGDTHRTNGAGGAEGIHGPGHPGPQGPGGGAQAPGHVHRRHRRARPAPPGLRGGGQLHRRGHGRLLRPTSRWSSGKDDIITVTDNGRGIPVDMHKTEGKPALEVVLTSLHAGGKFDKGSYKVSGGLHGVGVSCVNALSEWLEVEVRRDGKVYVQEFERGRPRAAVAGRRRVPARPDAAPSSPSSPTTRSSPSGSTASRPCAARLRELAFLNRGLHITIADERGEKAREETFHYEGGIVEFVRWLNEGAHGDLPRADLLRGREGRRADRDRHGLQRRLRRDPLHLRQQHQHHRGRHPPVGLPRRPDPHAQRLRHSQRPAQEGPQGPDRRRRARGPDGDHRREDPRAPVRGPDQDQAGQHRGQGPGRGRWSTPTWPSTWTSTRARPRPSSTSASPRPRAARPRARPAT